MCRESVDIDILSLHQGASNEPKQKKARVENNSITQVSNDDDNDDDGDDDDDGVPYEKLRPTYTHEALCKLVQLGLVKHIISQNGDGLHGLSGIPAKNLSELHGNVFVEKCEKCGTRYERPFYVLDDHASLYYEELDDFGSTTLKKPRHAKQCTLCGLCHRTGRKCTKGKVCNILSLLSRATISHKSCCKLHAQITNCNKPSCNFIIFLSCVQS